MKPAKIGIITLPGNFNYGNRLQCYAMTQAVRRLGCEPFVLERRRCYSIPRSAYRFVKDVITRFSRGGNVAAELLSTPERIAAFKQFGCLIPTVVLLGKGFAARDSFDRILVGSDQVWNPNLINHQEKWYFATFARPEQRIAVSASLGIDRFSEAAQAMRVAKGVEGFSRVSVRESRGAELIKECAGIGVNVICDPTLTLSAKDWRAVADDHLTPNNPYVFTYLLGGAGPEASDVLDSVTKKGKIPVVPLTDRQKPDELDAGPAEFISLIDHAEHVVTDSFHAAAFASMLQTPLTIVHREGGTSMFSRLEQLSRVLGIEHKVYGFPEFDLSRAGDYGGVPEAIASEREKFFSYLEACLDV